MDYLNLIPTTIKCKLHHHKRFACGTNQENLQRIRWAFYVPFKNGVIPFDPDNIVENKVVPEVVIESVKYHAEGNNKDSIIFIEGQQQVELKYNENRIIFQYVALHFSNASLNQYAYQLEGYDKEWIPAGTLRSVTYTNLSPGDYTFKVKAANSDGLWNETGARFAFTILPPWWLTWWAYTLYALIFLGALRAFSKYRERNLRSEKEKLEEKVEERTNSLKATLDNLKYTQSNSSNPKKWHPSVNSLQALPMKFKTR